MSNPSQFQQSAEFLHSFDRKPFLLTHGLSHHELLTFPALHRLAMKAATAPPRKPTKRHLLRDPVPPGYLVIQGRSMRWGGPEFCRILDDAFEHLEDCNARIKLTAIHKYEGYRELLAQCAENLSEITGVDFRRHYDPGIATFFISSPEEITPYHIDQEVNFLLQIHGQKQVQIFDGEDRNIVSPRNLEEFWMGRNSPPRDPASTYWTFEIGPGQGVFNPPFFPHTVVVGKHASVSLSLGFSRRRFPEAEIYRMNAYMRKFGWSPKPPGASQVVDRIKSVTVRRAVSLKRSVMGT